MIDTKNMSEKDLQKVINVCTDELIRRKYTQRYEAAKKALFALEELVKVAPSCYVDMGEDEAPVFLDALIERWKYQNFSFD